MARPVDLSLYRDPPEHPAAAECDLSSIEALLDRGDLDPGDLDRAEAGIAALIAADPAEAASWFLQARLLAARGQPVEAREACRRAIGLWPDILPVCRLLSELGEATDAEEPTIGPVLDTARRMLLAQAPDDAMLANTIAGRLCAEGRFAAALPYLRQAAPVLGHRHSALWNYSTSLAVTGGYHELLAIEPMLVAYARDVPPPFGPFVHLAGARLALQADRDRVLREVAALPEAGRWLDAAGLGERLREAIDARRRFSVVLLSEGHARLVCHASLRAHLILGEAEMSAVVNSVWREAFGATMESHGAAAAACFGRRLLSAIASADVIALPDGPHLAAAHEHFGFLAETQRIALERARPEGVEAAYAGLAVIGELHQAMPFLRPLLANQPFLGFVGFYPDLAERLGRFAQIGETVTYRVPAALDRGDVPAALRGPVPDLLEQTLAALVVPFEGAIFLVAAGLLGTLCCGRIRDLGGIAIDIDTVVAGWMPATG